MIHKSTLDYTLTGLIRPPFQWAQLQQQELQLTVAAVQEPLHQSPLGIWSPLACLLGCCGTICEGNVTG